MEELLLDIFFWGVFVGGGTIFVIFCIVMYIKQLKRDIVKQKELKNESHKPEEPEYTTVTTKATVVDQTCCVKTIGIKTPKTIQEFSITFQTENGEIISLNVPKEMYDGFDKNQTGILTVVDGQLCGFELTEDSTS